MIFRTKGLKASSLLTIPFYCFVLIAPLHPDTGHCGKPKDKLNKLLLEDQSSDEEEEVEVEMEPPPPYSPEAVTSAEVFAGDYLQIGDISYLVHDTGQVAPVSMWHQNWDQQYLDISYVNLEPKRYKPGEYITTPVKFSTFDHHQEERSQYTGTLWLFPNGIGSKSKRGRVLVTLQNPYQQIVSKKESAPEAPPSEAAALTTTDANIYTFRMAVTLQHSKAKKSASAQLALHNCTRTLIDLGSSSSLGKFKGKLSHNTIRLSITPCSYIIRDRSVAPGHGHSFVYTIPYGSLLHERHMDGTPTPQARSHVAIGTGWIEVDGQLIGFALRNQTSHITTHLYSTTGHSKRLKIQEHHRSHDAETRLSSAQKKAIQKREHQEGKERFLQFMRNRNLTIYWDAPNGQSHTVGEFGINTLRYKLQKGREHFITRRWESSIRYKRLFEELGGRNAIFRLDVSAPASDQDRKSHSGQHTKLASDGRGKDSVQPPLSDIAAHFPQLHISKRKMGTSAVKSQ